MNSTQNILKESTYQMKKLSNNWYLPDNDTHGLTNQTEKKFIYGLENFNSKIVNAFLKHCKRKRVFLDIGAAFGAVSRAVINDFEEVHSFEINIESREALLLNMQSYSNSYIYDFGCGSHKDTVQLAYHDQYRNVGSILNSQFKPHFRNDKWKPNRIAKVEVRPIDSMNFKYVDAVKIDVEGYELQVLDGMKNTLKNNSPIVIVESYNTDLLNTYMKETHQYKRIGRIGKSDIVYGKYK